MAYSFKFKKARVRPLKDVNNLNHTSLDLWSWVVGKEYNRLSLVRETEGSVEKHCLRLCNCHSGNKAILLQCIKESLFASLQRMLPKSRNFKYIKINPDRKKNLCYFKKKSVPYLLCQDAWGFVNHGLCTNSRS